MTSGRRELNILVNLVQGQRAEGQRFKAQRLTLIWNFQPHFVCHADDCAVKHDTLLLKLLHIKDRHFAQPHPSTRAADDVKRPACVILAEDLYL